MLIYLCGSLDETEVGTSAPCEGMVGETVTECRSGSLIAGWAVGGAVSLYKQICSKLYVYVYNIYKQSLFCQLLVAQL